METLPVLWLARIGGNKEKLTLAEGDLSSTSVTIIKEDEHVYFVLRVVEPLTCLPILWIQDVELECTGDRKVEEAYEYYWQPVENRRLFLNHFGQSVITIEIQLSDRTIQFHTCVEIVATKLNAERAEQMLVYLEERIDDLIRICFSATHKKGTSTNETERHASVLLQESRKGLNLFVSYLPRLMERKMSRLLPKPQLQDWTLVNNITENSIQWVLTHLDILAPASMPSPSNILVNNKRFNPQEIETEVLKQDTDVYENQVLMGYLEEVALVLMQIERQYRELLRNIESSKPLKEIPIGYQSLHEIRKRFADKYYGRLINDCQELQKLCRRCITFCQQHLPVRRTVRTMPKMTAGFSVYIHYRRIFEYIVSFYRLGKLNISGDRFIYGLRTLDKLYEFFCLYQLIEALQGNGLKLVSALHTKLSSASLLRVDWKTKPADKYDFVDSNGEVVRLLYEPRVNIESESQTTANLIDTYHSRSDLRPYFIPDFLLEFRVNQQSVYVVLDSKYTTPKYAREQYLPDLTMKYIHRLGNRNGGHSDVKALFILHPKSEPDRANIRYYPYHQRAYDIFSTKPALPALGTIQLTPEIFSDKSQNVGSELARIVGQVVVLLKNTL